MKTSQEQWSIKDLVALYESQMITTNAEYQRGEVWSETQQKKLIDSLFRGYTLPLIYLHDKKTEIAGRRNDSYEIIDGQQRLTAIRRYVQGAFRLFDPKVDNNKAKFPRFLVEIPCAWAGKAFRDLSPELKNSFETTKLLVAEIESDDANEVRDLFVRLQAGAVLNAQERRDAMPGGMNDFILSLGGKPDIIRYPGHEFFKEMMGARPGSDRGKTRQLAAQVTSLLLSQQKADGASFPDVNAMAIDQLYYDNLDFDSDGDDGKRVRETFDLLHRLLRDGRRPRLRGHDVIHAALLVNRLRDEFTPAWQGDFAPVLDAFLENSKGANKVEATDLKYQYWLQYGILTRSNSGRGESITRRHSFYMARMLEAMPSTMPIDPVRKFSKDMREFIYFLRKKRCAVCGRMVQWEDAEVHHVKEHKEGGKTTLDNAALVHKECHPRASKDVEEFAQKWEECGPDNMLCIHL